MDHVTRIFDILFTPSGEEDGHETVLHSKVDGFWTGISKSKYREDALCLASSLLDLGLRKGDRVATVIHNSPEWNVVDMALLITGMIQVPLYASLTAADYIFILREAGVRLLITDDASIARKIEPFREDLPRLRKVIQRIGDSGKNELYELIESSCGKDPAPVFESMQQISPEDTATIIYTSGTTGSPKGVMLSHKNMVSNFLAVAPISGLKPGEKALSALPLCHVYERMLNYMYQYLGVRIFYAESLLSIAENMREVKPNILCAVPRILEKFYDRILEAGRNRKGTLRCFYLGAMRFALHYDPCRQMSPSQASMHRLFDKLVYRRWRLAMGGQLHTIVSGGASLQPRLARLFWAAGIKVTEGYGLTETSPVIAVNHPEPENLRIGTVGPLLPGVEVKIAPDGEILCKGPNVMQGYYLNPELTQEMIDEDGWLHTGDIGCFEEGRFLKITDRKKEMFKTSGGKYIAPQVIENVFKESSFIEHIMVIGENRRFPAAIIIPDFKYLRSWCEVKGIHYEGDEQALGNPVIYARLDKEVGKLNQHFSRTEQIKRFTLLKDEWTQENGLLSPTLKLRRSALKARYLKQILALYAE